MTQKMRMAQIGLCVFLLGVIMSIESYTDWDMRIQTLLYDGGMRDWIISRTFHEHWKWLLYDGPKIMLIILGIVCAVVSVYGFSVKRIRRNVVLLLFSLIFVPLVLSSLKQVSNVYCPYQLQAFGGSYAVRHVLDSQKWGTIPERGRGFPAGHASGGFALMMLFFCAETSRRRWLGLGFGLAAGWSMGLYQMFRGQHFLTHTLFSMIAAWLIILCLVGLAGRFLPHPVGQD